MSLNEFMRTPPKLSRLAAGVASEFGVGDHGDVAAGREELHDFGAFASHFCPAGLGLGILFEGTIGRAFEFEVNLGETALCGAADRIDLAGESDFLGAVNEGLAPD